ncbi:hypothetical protein GN956_G4359 [Arapaima gigas]
MERRSPTCGARFRKNNKKKLHQKGMMCWIRIAVICLLLPLCQADNDCTQSIRWGDLLEDLNNFSDHISVECGVHYKRSSLCDPQEMLKMVEHNAVLLLNVLKKAEVIYKKHHKTYKFVDGLVYARSTLGCVHHLLETNLEPVDVCFNKLDTFLKEKESHSRCAWEIVTAKMREILQRLERRTVQRQ